MQDLLTHVLSALRDSDLKEVYPSFDAVPVSRKSSALFTVITQESIQIEPCFPYGLTDIFRKAYPFSAVFKVSVLVPMSQPLETAEDYFYHDVAPVMETLGSTLCDVLPPHVDAALGRIVMEARYRARGVFMEGDA